MRKSNCNFDTRALSITTLALPRYGVETTNRPQTADVISGSQGGRKAEKRHKEPRRRVNIIIRGEMELSVDSLITNAETEAAKLGRFIDSHRPPFLLPCCIYY